MESRLSKKQIRYKMPYRLIMFLKKHKALCKYIDIIHNNWQLLQTKKHAVAMFKYISMSIYITLDVCDDQNQEFWLNIYCSEEFKNFIKEEKIKQKRYGILPPLW